MNRRGRSLPRCHRVRCHWAHSRWVHSAGLLLLCCGFSSQAWGYCRLTTFGEWGSVDDDGCPTEGEALYWPEPCIPMGVHEAAAEHAGISYESAHDALTGAFSKWASVECDGKPVALGLVDRGVMHCGVVEYQHEARHSNNNILMFRDQWPYDEATPALTTTTFAVSDGRILDADIEVNTSVVQGSNGETELDLDAVLLHEVGHVLGLAHSQVSGSVMSADLEQGATQPLSDDDRAAICDTFGSGAPRCKTEREGVDFTRECAEPSELSSDSGCGGSPVAADPTGPRGATVPLLGALALWRARRRRRSQRRT